MSTQASDQSHNIPQVIVAQRVIDKIVRGALLYPEPETGEAMIGLIVPREGRPEPDIYVLDTLSPGEYAVREWGMFEQGDDWQGDVFHWMHVNWESFRELRRASYGSALAAKWDTPLMHVGDWHKQPGDMTAPSAGDAQTARHMIADAETPVELVVAPIATLYPLSAVQQPTLAKIEETAEVEVEAGAAAEEEGPAAPEESDQAEETETNAASAESSPDEYIDQETRAQAILVPVEDKGWLVRIDFWYMSKRARQFVAVTPVIWPDERLPGLPPVAWHLAHPRRFDQEYALLTEAGYTVDVVRWDADGRPPYEICFSVYRPGDDHVIVLVTPADYPDHMPAARIAPLVSVEEEEDIFEKLYDVSQPVLMTDMPDWPWDSKRTLIELVWHIEKTVKKDGKS